MMHGVMFKDKFLMLPIGSCDMVLGIQWLCKLGNIHVNFEKLFMKFMYHDKLVTLKGTVPSFKTVDAKALNKISVNTAKIFIIKICTGGSMENNKPQLQEEKPREIQ